MNRIEKRKFIHNIKRKKGLRKKHTKGAFGAKPAYLKENKPQDTENKEVTTESPKF